MDFRIWLEAEENYYTKALQYKGKDDLSYLYCLLVQSIKVSPFTDIRIHNKLVEALRHVGWNEEAEELELVKPTEKDLEIANTNDSPCTL